MLLASEHVIKDDALRLQLMQISSHTEQWVFMDKLYKSRALQLLGLHKMWTEKPNFASREEITGAMADLYGLLTQLG